MAEGPVWNNGNSTSTVIPAFEKNSTPIPMNIQDGAGILDNTTPNFPNSSAVVPSPVETTMFNSIVSSESAKDIIGDEVGKGTSLKFKAPWEGEKSFSQGYNNPYSHTGNQKYALDIVDPKGKRFYVLAAADGVVDNVQIKDYNAKINGQYRSGQVREVFLKHTDATGATYYTVYLHLNDIYVKKGETVTQGRILGLSGNTGISDGIHLHFQLSTGSNWISTPIENLWMANSSGYYKYYNGKLGELDDKNITIPRKIFISDNPPNGNTVSQLTPRALSPGVPAGQTIPMVSVLKQKFEWTEANYTFDNNRKYFLFLNNTNDYPGVPIKTYTVTGSSTEIELQEGKIYRWNIAPALPDWDTKPNEHLYSEVLTFKTSGGLEPDTINYGVTIHNGSISGPLLQDVTINGTDGGGNKFEQKTDANGYTVIAGSVGSWKINASKSGFISKSWNKDIGSSTDFEDFFFQNSVQPSTAKLHTDIATGVTSNSAILHGHITGLKSGEEYPVCFRYEGGITGKTKVGNTIVSTASPDFEFDLTGLQPGVTYYYRAVHVDSQGVKDGEKHPIDSDNNESFSTSATSPVTPSDDGALDSFLENLNQTIENNPEYFNSEWKITKDQYKIMLASLAYAEGGKLGYSVHSSFLNESGPDMYQHVDASNFYFSRGIGPFQIDLLGYNWPTIKKLNSVDATQLTLSEHKRLLSGGVGDIDDVREGAASKWMAYGNNNYWASQWESLTGTNWDNVKTCNGSNPLPFTWNEFKIKYKNNKNSFWYPYGQVVKDIGKQHWLIKTGDEIETDSLKKIAIDKPLETYIIKAIGIGKEWEYYYANDESNGTEFLAYYNPAEEQYNLKSIFWREYVGGAYPEKIIKNPGQVQKAGKTLGHKVIQDETTNANVDVALIIDSSGSMVNNDPTNLRIQAAKLFIDLVDNEDKIAIVDFDDSVRTWQSLINVGGNREILKNAVNKVDSSGSTNIGGGLRYGYNELNGAAADPLHKKAVILLTDGQHNTGTDPLTVVPDYKMKGWPIYTIALSSAADKQLLKQISSDTNGQYYDVPESNALQDIYNRISLSIKGSSQLEIQKGQISQGQTIAKSMPIDSSIKAFNLVLTWPGSDLDLVLYYPDGSKVPINKSSPSGTADPGISYINQSTYEIYKVLSPQTGTWRYDIIGVDVKNQEDYTLTLSAATTIRLNAVIDKQDYYPGEDVLITAEFADESGGISSAQVNAKVTLPDLSEEPLVLFENGTGKYGCTFSNTTQMGHYSVLVEAEKNGVVRQQQLEFDTGTGSIPPPIANFIVNNTEGVLPFNVQFNDTSTSSITSWEWDFDNNGIVDSTIQNPNFTYTTAGNYSVRLHVAGPGGSDETVKINYITVKPTFFADFTVSPVTGTAPLTVKCTDKSIGNPTWLVYDFGDGINATGPNPVHIYQFPGVYTITLSIMKYNTTSYSVMGSVATKPNVITVNSIPVVPVFAKFAASPVKGTAPLTVSFTDLSTGSPTSRIYDFGDGSNATGPNPVHIYRFPGVYNVTLSVYKFDSNSGLMLSNASVKKDLIVVNEI